MEETEEVEKTEEIERTEKYKFMLAKKGNKEILDRTNALGFIFEPKFHGIRVFVYKDGNDAELINKKSQDIISRYPELLYLSNKINAETCVLDAMLVILKDKKQDFQLLQKRERLRQKSLIDKASKQDPVTLFVFDILEKNNEQLTDEFLRERKLILKNTISEDKFIKLVPYSLNGRDLWKKIQNQFSGLLAKESNSKYQPGKTWNWLHIDMSD